MREETILDEVLKIFESMISEETIKDIHEIAGIAERIDERMMSCRTIDVQDVRRFNSLCWKLYPKFQDMPTEKEASGPDTFQKIAGLTFGEALQAVKSGKRARRAGWNGKNQYIELARNVSYQNVAGEIVNSGHQDIGKRCIAFVGSRGIQLGWLASQADMLAEDWMIVQRQA